MLDPSLQTACRNHYLPKGMTWSVLVNMIHDPKNAKQAQLFRMRVAQLISTRQMGRQRTKLGQEDGDYDDDIDEDDDEVSSDVGGASCSSPAPSVATSGRCSASSPKSSEVSPGCSAPRVWVPYPEYITAFGSPVLPRDSFHTRSGELGMLVPKDIWTNAQQST